ncbi:MAG: hypothetical protein LBI86_08715 [Treponema sp.]|jgi:hypothetical protein|nr:hypothetical protein [Treponema sp.]
MSFRRFTAAQISGVFLAFFLCTLSCSPGSEVAVIWTDRPEFALYAEYFNSVQDQFKVEIRYFPFPSQEIAEGKRPPDIIAGSWLKNASTRVHFKSLDDFFNNGIVPKNDFYPRLLDLGNIEGKQYLLPVSFNLPALVFARDRETRPSSPFTIGFDEIKALGKAYNLERRGVYTRMGFSPAWNTQFLFIITALSGVSFREASPVAWDAAALERAAGLACEWTNGANTGVREEEDFVFRYFFEPPEKLALSGRILFTYMDSADFFTLPGGPALDFRWIAEENVIPLNEETVYYGICKKGRAKKASNAFTRWFFQTDTQRSILEKSRNNRLMETSFGIAGGFSAMRTVTEGIFPRFYPHLLDHMPPGDFLSPPNILPRDWTAIKEQVILPYLNERIRGGGNEIRPLERRVADWSRQNRK